MPWGYAAAAVGGIIASRQAGKSQENAAQMGVDQQNAQFEKLQELLKPYVNAGTGSLSAQQALLGLSGADAQKQAISSIEQSPMFGSMVKQGEEGILANASATGGLRGGNTQAALAQFRPNMLNALITQQYDRLGGLTSIGQNAAAGTGNAGMQTGTNITNLYGQMGAAQAGTAMGIGNTISSLGGQYGQYQTLQGILNRNQGGNRSPFQPSTGSFGMLPEGYT